MKEFLSGCASGLAQNLVGHPLDTMKVLTQNNKDFRNLRFVDYYKGFYYPAIHSILTTGISFEIFSNSNSYLKDLSNPKDSDYHPYISGFITGGIISPTIYLFDVGKIKSQMNQKITLNDFIKTKGLFTTFVRESIAVSLYLGSYFTLKEKYNISPYYSGALSGLINWTVTYPIDIVKTRQMTYNFTITESIKMGGLWKGYYICAIRSVLVNGIGFSVYEYFKKIL